MASKLNIGFKITNKTLHSIDPLKLKLHKPKCIQAQKKCVYSSIFIIIKGLICPVDERDELQCAAVPSLPVAERGDKSAGATSACSLRRCCNLQTDEADGACRLTSRSS